jgi:hypothetical protein
MLKKQPVHHLRSVKLMRPTTKDAASIRALGVGAKWRVEPGHRETTLLVGSGETYIVTLIERRTGMASTGGRTSSDRLFR